MDRTLIVIAGVAIVLLMLLAAGNVVLRIFGRPFSGTYELAGFLGALVISLAMGHTQRRKGHIVVDILTRKFPAGVRRVIDVVNYSICTVFFSAVAFEVFRYGMTLRRSGEVSETLKIAHYPVILIVSLGFVVLVMALLIDLIKTLVPRLSEPQP
jgi:TRAP-type C4-dicarboxylate transport system permease small subunit